MMSVFKNKGKQLPYAHAYSTFRSLCWLAPSSLNVQQLKLMNAANRALKAFEKEESYSNWVAFEEACSTFWEAVK